MTPSRPEFSCQSRVIRGAVRAVHRPMTFRQYLASCVGVCGSVPGLRAYLHNLTMHDASRNRQRFRGECLGAWSYCYRGRTVHVASHTLAAARELEISESYLQYGDGPYINMPTSPEVLSGGLHITGSGGG
jgi:hypothetical protein